jgi:hypothetical protein
MHEARREEERMSLATPQQALGVTVSTPDEVPAYLSDLASSAHINATYSIAHSVLGIRRDAVAIVLNYAGGKYVQAEVLLKDRSSHRAFAYGRVRWQGTSGQWTGAVVLFENLGRDDCEVEVVLENLDDRSGVSMWRYIWK